MAKKSFFQKIFDKHETKMKQIKKEQRFREIPVFLSSKNLFFIIYNLIILTIYKCMCTNQLTFTNFPIDEIFK